MMDGLQYRYYDPVRDCEILNPAVDIKRSEVDDGGNDSRFTGPSTSLTSLLWALMVPLLAKLLGALMGWADVKPNGRGLCLCLPGEQKPLSFGWFATSFFESLKPPQTDIECTRRGSGQSCMYISDLTESWDFSTRRPLPSGVRGWHNGSSETESENMVQSE
jgi:hypothetical protein